MSSPARPIRVLSDLHLGHPACRIDSVQQLRPLLEGAKTVVFNGDTWEMSNPLLREKCQTHFHELEALLEEVGAKGVFLTGNHDHEITDLHALDLEAIGVFIVHGDCLFDDISPWSPENWEMADDFARLRNALPNRDPDANLATRLEYTHQCREILGHDEHEFDGGRFRLIRSVFRIIFPPRRPWEILKCWTGVSRRASDFRNRHCPEAKFLVMGHVHRPGVWSLENGEVTLCNTGGFMSVGKARMVEISDDTISLYRISEKPESFRPCQKPDWSQSL